MPPEEGWMVYWEGSSPIGWHQAMKSTSKEASKEASLIQGLPDIGTYEKMEIFWLKAQ